MTDYTARRILLKNAGGEYLVPYTDKLERDLSDVSAEGTQAILSKVHTDGAVVQYWSANLTPTAYQTVVIHKTGSAAYFFVNKTGTNTATPPSSDTTNWEQIPTGAGAANADLSNLTATGNDKFVTKNTAQTISGSKTFSAVPVMTGTLTATDSSTKIPTTEWCQNNVGVVDYSSGSDVTASVFGTEKGYKPSYKGVLFIKPQNNAATSTISIYNASGTKLSEKDFNTTSAVSGTLVPLPVNPSFSYRVSGQYGTLGTDYYATFYPYKSH